MARPKAGREGGLARVPAADIAWCAGVSAQRRHDWAHAGRLKVSGPFTEHDAVETAIAFHLAHEISQKVATKAWAVVHRDVQRLLVAGSKDIWIIAAAKGPRHRAVAGAVAAAEAVAEMRAPCWLIPTAAVAAEARTRFGEIRQPSRASGTVRQLHQKRDENTSGGTTTR
jgi:hypothetical protein